MRSTMVLAAAAALAMSGRMMCEPGLGKTLEPPEPVDPEPQRPPKRTTRVEYTVDANTGTQRTHARTREMQRYARQQARIAEKRAARAAKEAAEKENDNGGSEG